jgi:hypothetical protein
VKLLEPGVLRRQPALARHIHRQHDRALQAAEQVFAAIKAVELKVKECLHHPLH